MVLHTIVYMAHLTSYCCKRYIINSTAVQQYMWFCCKRVPGTLLPLLLTAAAVRTESGIIIEELLSPMPLVLGCTGIGSKGVLET